MQLLTRSAIIDRMIQAVRSQTATITYFGPGPFRAFLYAVAAEAQHLYFKLFQVEQKLDVLSATGEALDAFGAGRGLPRQAATASSVLLVIEANGVITGTGQVTATGTTLTGIGTSFTTQLQAGDVIIVGGQERTIATTPTQNTTATLTNGFSVGSASAFQIRKASITIPITPTPLQVTTPSGVTFEATEVVTLLPKCAGSSELRGVVRARSQSTGVSQNVPAYSVRSVVNPQVVPLVTPSVTNPAASQGGADAESDAIYRNRIVTLFAGLNQGTAQFYDAQVRVINPNVSRIYLARGPRIGEVLVYCLRDDGSPLTTQEKNTIASGLAQVVPVQTTVTVRDMVLQNINVSFTTTMVAGATIDNIANALAEVYREYLNWLTWSFERSVQSDDLLRLASAIPGVDSLSVSSFLPATDVTLAPGTLPRVGTIVVTDAATGDSKTVTAVATTYKRLV